MPSVSPVKMLQTPLVHIKWREIQDIIHIWEQYEAQIWPATLSFTKFIMLPYTVYRWLCVWSLCKLMSCVVTVTVTWVAIRHYGSQVFSMSIVCKNIPRSLWFLPKQIKWLTFTYYSFELDNMTTRTSWLPRTWLWLTFISVLIRFHSVWCLNYSRSVVLHNPHITVREKNIPVFCMNCSLLIFQWLMDITEFMCCCFCSSAFVTTLKSLNINFHIKMEMPCILSSKAVLHSKCLPNRDALMIFFILLLIPKPQVRVLMDIP